jgi:hypothetical protein
MNERDRRRVPSVGRGEQPQEYHDLLRLVATIRGFRPPDPTRQTIREHLLAKLGALTDMAAMGRGGPRLA